MRYKIGLQLKNNHENSDEDYMNNYPQLNLLRKGKKWNDREMCFNYALDNSDIFYCEDGYEFLQDYYKKIKNGDIKEGDIIIYLDEADNKKHFAKVYETNGTIKDTIIRSKWGQLGVYETTVLGIPKIYGCYIEIWRKRNEM